MQTKKRQYSTAGCQIWDGFAFELTTEFTKVES